MSEDYEMGARYEAFVNESVRNWVPRLTRIRQWSALAVTGVCLAVMVATFAVSVGSGLSTSRLLIVLGCAALSFAFPYLARWAEPEVLAFLSGRDLRKLPETPAWASLDDATRSRGVFTGVDSEVLEVYCVLAEDSDLPVAQVLAAARELVLDS